MFLTLRFDWRLFYGGQKKITEILFDTSHEISIDPLTAGAAYIGVFIFY